MCCTASNGIFTISISVCRRAGIHLSYKAGSGSKVKSTASKNNNVSSVMVDVQIIQLEKNVNIRHTVHKVPGIGQAVLKK
jgi:hypothetical protein